MNISQTKSIAILAGIFSTRMLGLFIILPIFALYTHQLAGATPDLMGIALGAYGLTQASFQIPLAMLSDKMGRKPVILAGLLIFVIGSIVAALSESIYGIIIGRALQGAGAIGSTTIALVADLTTVENRTKAMAVIGMTIGLSFGVSMVIGPALNESIGLSGIFWTTAMLGVLGMGLLIAFLPTPPKLIFHLDAQPEKHSFKRLLLNTALLRLNFGIFSLHALLTASFIVIPILLADTQASAKMHTWSVYLPALFVAFMTVIPCIIVAEKFRCLKFMFSTAIFALFLSQLLLWRFHYSLLEIALVLTLFFIAFTFLESALPSLVSKIAPARSKGTAIGIYSTLQFLGVFVGGSLGGWLYHAHGLSGIFLFGSILMGIWFFVAVTMPHPPYLSTLMISVKHLTEAEALELTRLMKKIEGVEEVAIVTGENIAHLKIDKRTFNREKLDALLQSEKNL
jgi:MFS family permease